MIITAFDGSPRTNGNSTLLLKRFIENAERKGATVNLFKTDMINLKPCRGCLMCNVIKRCAIKNDDWESLSKLIMESDVLAFSTPVYFHHATSSMKKLLDRFRSFIHVKITEEGLIHTPHSEWQKKIFLFTALGSSSKKDAEPLIDLFSFMNKVLGNKNRFEYLTAERLAVSGQILFGKSQLKDLYGKLDLSESLVEEDYKRNRQYIEAAGLMADRLF